MSDGIEEVEEEEPRAQLDDIEEVDGIEEVPVARAKSNDEISDGTGSVTQHIENEFDWVLFVIAVCISVVMVIGCALVCTKMCPCKRGVADLEHHTSKTATELTEV